MVSGAFLIALGLFFGIYAYVDLNIGSAFRMGPGFFPVVLSGLLILIGIIVVLQSLNAEHPLMTPIAWRGLFFILLSPIVFGLTIRALGFVPAVVLVCGISAFASHRMGVLKAAIITVCMTLFCIGVFYYALGLPVRLFGGWLN
ncbi:membrane protein [Agaricicola taiwanensis]|uniref:Membrane protein n=2 Tax=Agaricicola taiwanensis TaxID=591372 RepID=A0A8J2YHE8_9RHOB|nr:membrane protein [Agaricicola taiwanensis]